MMRTAMRKLQVPREDVVVIGDRMNTDMLGGLQAEMTTCLVLTGISISIAITIAISITIAIYHLHLHRHLHPFLTSTLSLIFSGIAQLKDLPKFAYRPDIVLPNIGHIVPDFTSL